MVMRHITKISTFGCDIKAFDGDAPHNKDLRNVVFIVEIS